MVVRSCCLNEQGFAFSASGEVITSLTVAEWWREEGEEGYGGWKSQEGEVEKREQVKAEGFERN